MQVQMFEMTSVGGSEDLYRFKATVNNWLEKEGAKVDIIHILQNVTEKQGALSCIISIWYKAREDGNDKGGPPVDGAAKPKTSNLPAI